MALAQAETVWIGEAPNGSHCVLIVQQWLSHTHQHYVRQSRAFAA